MGKIIKKAPHLKEPWNNQPFSDLIILVGSQAWEAWGKGKGVLWQMLADGLQIEPFKQTNGSEIARYQQSPVILGLQQLEELAQLKIANEKQRYIKLIQCGELSEQHKTAICLNLATSTKADMVLLVSSTLDLIEDLSGYIQRLRSNNEDLALAEMTTNTPKPKENDRMNQKARAFKIWLGLDLALQRGSREIYAYNDKIWNKQDDDDLEESAVKFFDENEFGYSDKTINSLLNTLKAQLPRMGEMSNELIAFDNGVLNRNTLQFKPHDRTHWLTSCVPHYYNEKVIATPSFNRWLDFVSGGDQSKARNILAALYAILTNRYDWQIFLEITGKGGSGKSIFAKIATLLAGDKNTESGRLDNFDDEKGRAGFTDKTLIICPEQSKYAGDGNGLKSISGGDAVRINPKYKEPFKAVIPAIIMLVNNEPCKFTERAGGVERRRVIFNFDKVVPENERDPYLMEKMTLEIGGIIRKILDTFSDPLDAKKALEDQMNSEEALEIKKQSDPLTAFFEYFYTTETASGLFVGSKATSGIDRSRTHLYPAYLAYAQAINIIEMGLNNFVSGIDQALKQHKNAYEFIKKPTNQGRRTNIHFKDFEEFKRDFLK